MGKMIVGRLVIFFKCQNPCRKEEVGIDIDKYTNI